jgi:glycosyltransferase involved in cell wall biosynthesis
MDVLDPNSVRETPARVARHRILLVLTRAIPDAPRSGRERTLNFIRRALTARHDVTEFELTSVAHQPRVTRILKVIARLVRGVLTAQPCPLQVALFAGQSFSTLFEEIARTRAEVVYFDSIRTVDWLLATRRRFPALRLISDFDDLMSLRFATLLERSLPISLGYLESVTPRWLLRFLERGFVTRQVLAYEKRALLCAERRAVEAADAVSVVSSIDARQLRQNVGPELAKKTYVIPPGINFPNAQLRTNRCREFIFVGSDVLLQNRLTIEFLVKLWSTASPAIPLRIIGRMSSTYEPCEGVTFSGFVNDLADVYSDDVIALCPSFVEGGIKSKVLEALAHGVIPVGNSLTFQGMGCDPGCLAMTEDTIATFVCCPSRMIEQLRQAAMVLREYVCSRYSLEAVTEAWSRVVAIPKT